MILNCKSFLRSCGILAILLASFSTAFAQANIWSVGDGDWSNPNTWNLPRVPQWGDWVLISVGTDVRLDHAGDWYVVQFSEIEVDGRLFPEVEPDASVPILLITQNMIQVNAGGRIEGFGLDPPFAVPIWLSADVVNNSGDIIGGDNFRGDWGNAWWDVPPSIIEIRATLSFNNTGNITAGSAVRGENLLCPGGLIILSSDGGVFMNNAGGVIQSGDGWVEGFPPNSLANGGDVIVSQFHTINGNGGQILGGFDMGPTIAHPNFTNLLWVVTDENPGSSISFSGAGTLIDQFGMVMIRSLNSQPVTTISLTALDVSSVHARKNYCATKTSGPANGGFMWIAYENASFVDMQGNPNGTNVLVSEIEDPGGEPAFIRFEHMAAPANVLLDNGVTLNSICDPDPIFWGARQTETFSVGRLCPGIPDISAMSEPYLVPGLGFPGDTAEIFMRFINVGERHDFRIEISDELGYNYSPDTVWVDSVDAPDTTFMVWFKIPYSDTVGTTNDVWIKSATYPGGDLADSINWKVVVVPPVKVYPEDDFRGEPDNTDTISVIVRNHSEFAETFNVYRFSESWYVYPGYQSVWIPSHDEDTLEFYIEIPPGALPGDSNRVAFEASISGGRDDFWDADTTIVSIEVEPTPVNLTICQARQQDACGVPTYLDSLIQVNAIVSFADTCQNIAYIQDGSCGLALYGSSVGDTLLPPDRQMRPGDSIQVTGYLGQNAGLSEIEYAFGTAPIITLLDSDKVVTVTTLPCSLISDAADVGDDSCAGEDYESEEVHTEIIQMVLTGTFQGNTDYKAVCASGDTIKIRIDSCSDFVGQPIPTGSQTVVGILGQNDGSECYCQGYQIYPEEFIPPEGSIQLSADSLEFPATHLGSSVSLQVTVTNVSQSRNLAVYDITTTGHIWSVDTTNFILLPEGEQIVTVTFEPTFGHDFYGTVEFFSSDAVQPRDSLYISGMACKPVVQPPAPHLSSAASPTDIYFAIPWDTNGVSTLYAIEFSSDGFATSEFVAFPAGTDPDSIYATAAGWGQESVGSICGLEPDTEYEVRLWAKDCTGDVLVGSSSALSTLPDIIVEPAELTIQLVGPDTIELRWDPEVTDTAGNPLPNYGYIVYFGAEPDIIDSALGFSTSGVFPVSISADQKGFFYVDPIVEGVTDQPCPFISWPPDGATITGLNTVVIQDFAHQVQWDSFRVEIDSAGSLALIGSSFDNPWNLSGTRAAGTNFNRFDPGVHTITATVVDKQDRTWSSSVDVTIVPEPFSTFTAAYDSVTRIFTIDTAEVAKIGSGLADVLWPVHLVGERYGGTITVEWKEGMDSLTILKPFLKLLDKELTETAAWFQNCDPYGGVLPTSEYSRVSSEDIRWCCVTLKLRTSGKSKGKYGDDDKHKKLGPFVGCPSGAKRCQVGYVFEVVCSLATDTNSPYLYYGQDAKGDRMIIMGTCRQTPWRFAAECSSSGHKTYDGKDYPRDSTEYGNDDYRGSTRRNRSNMDARIDEGRVSWLDRPQLSWEKAHAKAYRFIGDDQFIARCAWDCPGSPDCCKQWDLVFDVVCCQSGKTIVNQWPTIQNITDECHELAPD